MHHFGEEVADENELNVAGVDAYNPENEQHDSVEVHRTETCDFCSRAITM